MTAEPITSPTTWPSADAQPDVLYGIYDNYLEEFTEAYVLQREADDRAIELNDLNFNSYDRVAGAEERFSVDQLPTPWPDWCVRP